jgi:hypothetical protein
LLQLGNTAQQGESPDVQKHLLIDILVGEGASKHYTGVSPLGAGTVGIANVARGGLASRYRQVGKPELFGLSVQETVANYSNSSRPGDVSWRRHEPRRHALDRRRSQHRNARYHLRWHRHRDLGVRGLPIGTDNISK